MTLLIQLQTNKRAYQLVETKSDIDLDEIELWKDIKREINIKFEDPLAVSFKCSICNYKTGSNTQLKKHIESVHEESSHSSAAFANMNQQQNQI